MKSLKHYSRQYRIWRNKQKHFFSLKKLTPLMLSILLSKEAHGQDKKLNDFMPNNDFFSTYCYFLYYNPTFVDLDSDGDMDIIFIRNYDWYEDFKSVYLKNNGTKDFPNYVEDDFIKDSSNLYQLLAIDSITFEAPSWRKCFFYDFNHDGFIDILRTDFDSKLVFNLHKNISEDKNKPIFDTLHIITLDYLDIDKIVDINNDGLEDLVSIDETKNQLNYVLNTGTLNLPNFGSSIIKSLEFDFLNKKGAIEDLDGDGFDDIAVFTLDNSRYYALPSMVTFHKCISLNPLTFDSIEKVFIYDKQFLLKPWKTNSIFINLIDFDGDIDIDIFFYSIGEGSYSVDYISGMSFLENKNSKSMNLISGMVNLDWNKNLKFDEDEYETEYKYLDSYSYGYELNPKFTMNPKNYFAAKNINCKTIDTILKFPIPTITEKCLNYYSSILNPKSFYGNIPAGNVKIYPDSLEGFTIVPPFYEFNFAADTNYLIDSLKFHFQPIIDEKNLSVELTGFANRPGFEVYQNLTYQNKSALLDSGIIAFTPDSLYTFIESNPAPTSNSSGTYYWIIDSIDKFETRYIDIKLLLSADAEIGKKTKSTALFNSNFGLDRVPQNNYDTLIQFITGSFDPNDKIVTPVPDNRGIIEITDQPFEYTVRFQNTGNDTAFTVIITDTLEKDFDINTFKLLAASDPFVFDMKSGNVATWRFNQILLPPKETNEQGSNGFVKYSIKPLEGKGIGTEFTNTANIYFDFNKPIVTNETRNIFGVINGIHLHDNQPEINIKAYPNPVHDKLLIEINNPKKEDMIFRVYDINGTELFSKTINSNFFHFSTQDYAPAMYLYTIESANEFGKGKFVKE